MVIVTGSPSGMAEAARVMEVETIWANGLPLRIPARKTRPPAIAAILTKVLLIPVTFSWSGVTAFSWVFIKVMRYPISVLIPVPTTSPSPLPLVISVPR